MVLAYPGVTLCAITTVMGNISLAQATHNAGAILDAAHAPQIPIYKGCAQPLMQYPPLDAKEVHGSDGLGNAAPQTTNRHPQALHAALALINLVRENPGKISLLTLGPLTNIALALRLDPTLLQQLHQLVIMGGSVDGRGNTTPVAEFNFLVDPEAAAIVFDACRHNRVEATLVSWEATLAHPQPAALWTQSIFGSSVLSRLLQKITIYLEQIGWTSPGLLWADPLAAAVLLEPEIVQDTETRFISVDTGTGPGRGQTLADYRPNNTTPCNAHIIRQVDLNRFHQLLHLAVEQ